jgi:hypothetical protein
MRTEAVLDAAVSLGLQGAFHWEIYDNECKDANMQSLNGKVALSLADPLRPTLSTCAGFWIVRPDGSQSPIVPTLRRYW